MVSGLPASGKSWLAVRLAPLLDLPVIDKDQILEHLFDTKGVGDAGWRRDLSREADRIFRAESEACGGALLVSHWCLPGMPESSGTPTDWLLRLSKRLVNLHCDCSAEIATARFIQRQRHAGHLDGARSRPEILASIRELERCEPLRIGRQVRVDTSTEIDVPDLASRVSEALECSAWIDR